MTSFRPKKKYLSTKEIDRAIEAMRKVASNKQIPVALVGGTAMQYYGSDRLTQDVDFIGARTLGHQNMFKPMELLIFGGLAYTIEGDIPVDLIVRKDGYKQLYEEALRNAITAPDGTPIVTPEHLAAMKFGSGREKDLLDLAYLVTTPKVVDMEKAAQIVFRTLGGQHAKQVWDEITDRMIWKAARDKDEKGRKES